MQRPLASLILLAASFGLHGEEKLPKLATWVAVNPEAPKPKGAKLGRKAALRIANNSLPKLNPKAGKTELLWTMYSHDTKTWFIGFRPVGSMVVGSDFGIYVHESDLSTTLLPGQ